MGSTILTQREVNTIGKFFNINDPDEVLNQLSDNDIKIMIGSEQVPFPDDTIERIITTLFDKEESKKIIYESIPRIITELDLPQIFYKMRETEKENERTPEEATKEIEGGDDNADNTDNTDNADEDETPKADPMGDKIAQITINELPISDGLQGQNTSFDERLIDLKMDIVDKITPKIVELLNNRENDQTALERMLTSFISDDKFTDSIRDVIIAKISYLITELGTQVIYKTFTENEELVPLLKDVLKSMDAIAKLERLKEEANAEKNTQRATLISEVIQDLNDSLQKDVRDIVSTKITPEKNEDVEESVNDGVDEEEEESIVESVDEEEEESIDEGVKENVEGSVNEDEDEEVSV